jgi:uncharacterized RDD family membrane protein YckC
MESTTQALPKVGNMEKASQGQRMVAFLIDSLIAFIPFLILPNTLAYLIYLAYMLTRDAIPYLDGVSLGKRFLKIRAVREDGTHLTGDYLTSFKRNIIFAIPYAGALIELAAMIINDDDHRIGDQWFNTRVVVDPSI